MTDIDDGDDSDRVKRPGPHAPQLTAEQARQARRGRPVLWILIVGTGLAFIGMLAALGIVG